ncbi:MAG: CoA ester lyase [Streptosporangiales bacterium]|nr:CoA ester lyase [Streptosporangiales bacterium]MBO0891767.1 CoA ester lyase [Acidothermales bacterium]
MSRAPRLRSLLFVPGDRPDRIAKAITASPDGVVVDLEDAVHPSRLRTAREQAVTALRDAGGTSVLRMVRVHHAGHDAFAADVDAVVGAWLDAVMLSKVDVPGDVLRLDAALTSAETSSGLPHGTVGIVPLVESCRGLRFVHEIAGCSRRTLAVAFSSGEEGDFMADLGGRWTQDGAALHYPRSRFVCDVRAAGDLFALDGVCMHLDDPGVLSSECALAATLGFDGKLAIHPAQLTEIHRTFTPSRDAVTEARDLLAALADATRNGVGATRHGGRMVDAANARIARRTLAKAGHDVGGASGD